MFNGTEVQRSIVLLLLAWAATELINGVESEKCSYQNSVDLATIEPHANGSYTYDGLLIPPDWIENFKVEEQLAKGQVKVRVEKRACICKVRPCVSLCCENPKATLNLDTNECEEHEVYTETPKINIRIENQNGQVAFNNNFDGFFQLRRIPCDNIAYIESDWQLLKNGSVPDNKGVLETEHYCLHGGPSDTSDEITYNLYTCSYPNEPTFADKALLWTKLISAICLILATVVYLVAGKKTTNQNLFIGYFITLSITFLSMNIDFNTFLPTDYCTVLAFFSYFSLMAAFCMLTVISISMWNKFRGYNFYAPHSQSKKRFLIHYLFAFGGASLITLGTTLVEFLPIDDKWKPKMGVYACWVTTEYTEGAYLNLYGPLSIFISINTVMFILTSIRIFKLKKEANFAKATNKKLRAAPKKFRFSNEFKLYLRIFFSMGLPWIFEIILYPIGAHNCFIFAADLLNAAQGIIILIITPNILQLIYERFIMRQKSVASHTACQSASGLSTAQRL